MRSHIKDSRVHVPSIEIHAAHACNLKCQSCSHYSYATPGMMQFTDIFKQQLHAWSQKIDPKYIKILGGEPFLNKDIFNILSSVKDTFKQSKIQLSTNALLIKNVKDIDKLNEHNVTLIISQHSDEVDYMQQLRYNLDILDAHDIKYHILDSYKTWRHSHKIEDGIITPFQDNDNRTSWEVCPSKYCKQLYEGKIYKCPQTTYINLVNKPVSPLFQPMKDYVALEHTSSLEDILNFFNKEEEHICYLCPKSIQYFKKTI
jgi:organic radical activating enzyme